MYDLEGKVAVVTGAGGERGIGRAVARRLAREGADVVVSDIHDRGTGDWGGLPAVVSEIEATGRRAIGQVTDVTDSGQVQALIDRAVADLGKVDILVNNAGSPAGPDRVPVVELEEDVWDLVLDVNAKGTFLCARAAARHMIARGGGGKIVNVSSVAGKRGRERFAAYCSSKFAVIGFTQCLALELAPHRVNVNAICPGLIDTERVYGIASGIKPADVSTEDYRDRMIEEGNAATPLGRVGTGDDVAQLAAYLSSAESDYMTGLALTVAGGSHMN